MKRRYNVFNEIHKALRGMLYDTGLTLQLTDFTTKEESTVAIEKLELVLSLLQEHLKNENDCTLPAIKLYRPALVGSLQNEHEKVESLTHRLQSLVAVYYNSISNDEKDEAGYSICKAFNEFIAFNLMYMNRKETEVNEVLWKRLSDANLVQLSKAIITGVPQEIQCLEHKWLLKSISNPEIICWMVKVKDHAPHYIFQSLLLLAEKVLPEERWNKVREGLSEGVMVLEPGNNSSGFYCNSSGSLLQ